MDRITIDIPDGLDAATKAAALRAAQRAVERLVRPAVHPAQRSFYDAMVESGQLPAADDPGMPSDLSSHPRHLEGFGE